MTKLSKEAMREYQKERRARKKAEGLPLGAKFRRVVKEDGSFKDIPFEGRAEEAQPGTGDLGESGMAKPVAAGSSPARPEVYPFNAGETRKWEKPVGVSGEQWAECMERAQRARRYAQAMPDHVRPSEEIFQSPIWQWENEVCKRLGT